MISQVAYRVVVAHPGQLRLIFRSKKKNDRADAEKLAKLLFLGEVPMVYVPNEDVRSWRQLVEYRHRLIAKRTRSKNALRAIIYGLLANDHRINLDCGLVREWLGWSN